MTFEIDKDNAFGLNNTPKNLEPSLKVENNHTPQLSNIDKEQMEARQRVFN